MPAIIMLDNKPPQNLSDLQNMHYFFPHSSVCGLAADLPISAGLPKA